MYIIKLFAEQRILSSILYVYFAFIETIVQASSTVSFVCLFILYLLSCQM